MPGPLPDPRALPEIAPDEGPDPTNTDAGVPAVSFIPTTSADNT
ncbi:hypothetical protein [Nocardia nova]|nr:hypothetical protein [Nocardia nova]